MGMRYELVRSTPMSLHPGFKGSILDVIFLSESLMPSVDARRVLRNFSVIDHQYIAFGMVDVICRYTLAQHWAWNVAKMSTKDTSGGWWRCR